MKIAALICLLLFSSMSFGQSGFIDSGNDFLFEEEKEDTSDLDFIDEGQDPTIGEAGKEKKQPTQPAKKQVIDTGEGAIVEETVDEQIIDEQIIEPSQQQETLEDIIAEEPKKEAPQQIPEPLIEEEPVTPVQKQAPKVEPTQPQQKVAPAPSQPAEQEVDTILADEPMEEAYEDEEQELQKEELAEENELDFLEELDDQPLPAEEQAPKPIIADEPKKETPSVREPIWQQEPTEKAQAPQWTSPPVEPQEPYQSPRRKSWRVKRRARPLPTANAEDVQVEPVKVGNVEIEPQPYGRMIKKCNCRYDALIPYKSRRESWTTTVGISYNTYQPTNYQPDAFVLDFDSIYSDAESPMIDLTVGFKKSASFGYFSLDIGGSYYNNESDYDSSLNIMSANVALSMGFEFLFGQEPYLVPYATVGMGYVIYEESTGSSIVDGGTTQGYAGGGIAFQLDWMDEDADISSYEELGVENTFLFIEGRMYLDSLSFGGETAPDFSSDSIAYLAGLKMEF